MTILVFYEPSGDHHSTVPLPRPLSHPAVVPLLSSVAFFRTFKLVTYFPPRVRRAIREGHRTFDEVRNVSSVCHDQEKCFAMVTTKFANSVKRNVTGPKHLTPRKIPENWGKTFLQRRAKRSARHTMTKPPGSKELDDFAEKTRCSSEG